MNENTTSGNPFFQAIAKVASVIGGELIFRGILFILLGIFTMTHPASTMLIMTEIIGAFIIIDGIGMLIAALRGKGKARVFSIIGAAIFILFGIFTCASPLKMNVIWIVMLGFWQLFSGIQCLFFAGKLPGSSICSGLLSILVGLCMVSAPFIGLMSIYWLLGLMLLISGISALFFGIRLKKALK